uniref:Uncharacterized protein n=1 Tax=Cucumis melo TaxID=3656 RepID=A0A9I9CZN0_CUCME
MGGGEWRSVGFGSEMPREIGVVSSRGKSAHGPCWFSLSAIRSSNLSKYKNKIPLPGIEPGSPG